MLRFLSITFLMIGFSVIILTAQDKYPSGSNVDETSELIIPIHVLLQNAMSGRITWQPDWPSSIPVDAFNILNDEWARNVSAVTLLSGNVKLTARRDEQGLFTEFPVFMNGIFYQFKTRFDSKGRISGFAMDGESPIEIEFLAFENADGKPSLARIRNGGVWLFASLLDQNGLSLETWYDAGGTPLAVFSAQSENGQVRFYKYAIQSSPEEMGNAPQTDKSPNITAPSGTKVPTIVMAPGSIVRLKVFHFDGMGNTTQVGSERGIFEAVYNGKSLYYWKDPAARRVALQWDGRGLLVRMAGIGENNAALDYRYEYIINDQGAWTERREFRMEPRLGVLVPVAGTYFTRTIEYR